MQHIKITRTGRRNRLTAGFTYILERLDNGLLRISSVGGKFSTLVDPDTSDVEFEYTGEPVASPLKGWRNTYAVNLWNEVYTQSIVDEYCADSAAERADRAVGQFKERWEGTIFLHNAEQVA